MTRLERSGQQNRRGLTAWLGVLALIGCASTTARPPRAPVELSETLPVGYDALGPVSASCRQHPSSGSFHGEPATSFACTPNELSRALAEQANARGGTLLAGAGCHREDDERLVCSAEAGRRAAPNAAAAPLPPEFDDGDDELLATVASRIRIDLDSSAAARREPRSSDRVTEFAAMPVGHLHAGVLRARCAPSDCDVDQARAGLRLAAGALGASDLVGVRCVIFDGEQSCVATLGVTEREAAADVRAR
jgi:hypothetical protein